MGQAPAQIRATLAAQLKTANDGAKIALMSEILGGLLADVTDGSKMVNARPKVEAIADVLGDAGLCSNDVVVQVGTRAINLIN